MSPSPPKRRWLRPPFPLAIIAPLLLSGCMSTLLWGGNVDYEGEHTEINFEPDFSGPGDLLIKVLLTPFAVVYDVCTSPFQAWMCGWLDFGDD